jgi:hypothetical protein
MVHRVIREHTKQTVKSTAGTERLNLVAPPQSGVIHRYDPKGNTIVARSVTNKADGTLNILGTFRMAGSHHSMEANMPKSGDRVLLFSSPPPLRVGFAILDHDASGGAWTYARVGGEMYVSSGQ